VIPAFGERFPFDGTKTGIRASDLPLPKERGWLSDLTWLNPHVNLDTVMLLGARPEIHALARLGPGAYQRRG
jgi:hypothetical protein